MAYRYDEELAQKLLSDNKKNELIEYCIPTVAAYLKTHTWSFITVNNLDDIYQELYIALINAVNSYDPHKEYTEKGTGNKKDVKLFTWINNYYKWRLLDYSKSEMPYRIAFTQGIETHYNQDGYAITHTLEPYEYELGYEDLFLL